MPKQFCLVDLDGVLADFVGAAFFRHGVSRCLYDRPENRGVFSIAKVLGMSEQEFWEPLNSHHFWASIPPTEELKPLIEMLEEIFPPENIGICTAFSASPQSASGKMEWVRDNLWSYRRRLIMTPFKRALAHNNAVLIDDRDRNCEKFEAAGGQAILFPRPWNTLHEWEDAAVDVVEKQLC